MDGSVEMGASSEGWPGNLLIQHSRSVSNSIPGLPRLVWQDHGR